MENIIGILVFTQQVVLDHKLRDGKQSDNAYCFWEMGRFPKRIMESEMDDEVRLYMAIKGQVKGYFVIHDCSEDLEFYSESWHSIENGEQLKPSQGFRYYTHTEVSADSSHD